jgi:acetolactate synthase II small subunit
MKHRMQVELKASEGAMLRAFGLVERRGFRVQSCTLHAARDGRHVLDLTVESARPVQVLKRQLERLHDVLAVQLEAAQQFVQNAGMQSSMGRQP